MARELSKDGLPKGPFTSPPRAADMARRVEPSPAWANLAVVVRERALMDVGKRQA
jgi:hypothetical protein